MRIEYRATSVIVIAILYFLIHSNLSYKKHRQVERLVKFFNLVINARVFPGHTNEDKIINNWRLHPNENYCIISDSYKYYHPEVILNDMRVFREVPDLPRQIIREINFDMIPKAKYYSRNKQQPLYRLPKSVNILYPYYLAGLYGFRHGKSFNCMFQKHNHVHGHSQLSQKQDFMNNYYQYIDQQEERNISKQCITKSIYIPESYRMFKRNECLKFIEMIQSESHRQLVRDKGPQYLTKVGDEVHRGRGITVLFEKETDQLIKKYDNGSECGDLEHHLIAQRYITNPYLYKNHKIEFRIYWFIVSTNPLIVYSYSRPLIKRCAKEYNIHSIDKAAHICNTAIVKKSIEEDSNIDKDENDIEEEEFFIDWDFEGLQQRLIKEGRIKNKNWLSEYLYPLIYKKLIHMMRSVEKKFSKDSRNGEFFATDFLMSDDLQIYILETNYNPQILAVTPDRIVRNYKMVQDTIEIMNVYLKSRYVRMKKLINQILEKHTDLNQQTLMTYQQKIVNLYRDILDQGIKINEQNLYVKIIDGNYQGSAKYLGYIDDECL